MLIMAVLDMELHICIIALFAQKWECVDAIISSNKTNRKNAFVYVSICGHTSKDSYKLNICVDHQHFTLSIAHSLY